MTLPDLALKYLKVLEVDTDRLYVDTILKVDLSSLYALCSLQLGRAWRPPGSQFIDVGTNSWVSEMC